MFTSWSVDDLAKHTHRECANLLLDDLIGVGTHRAVYSSSLLPDCVVKIETGPRFANIIEWEVWSRIQSTEFAKWFAPCVSISPNGLILIQKRTQPAYDFPEKIPAFFSDIKGQNWGMLEGRLVCHDYGNNLLMERGMTRRMRKINWFEDSKR
jgi:hypothetical protein